MRKIEKTVTTKSKNTKKSSKQPYISMSDLCIPENRISHYSLRDRPKDVLKILKYRNYIKTQINNTLINGFKVRNPFIIVQTNKNSYSQQDQYSSKDDRSNFNDDLSLNNNLKFRMSNFGELNKRIYNNAQSESHRKFSDFQLKQSFNLQECHLENSFLKKKTKILIGKDKNDNLIDLETNKRLSGNIIPIDPLEKLFRKQFRRTKDKYFKKFRENMKNKYSKVPFKRLIIKKVSEDKPIKINNIPLQSKKNEKDPFLQIFYKNHNLSSENLTKQLIGHSNKNRVSESWETQGKLKTYKKNGFKKSKLLENDSTDVECNELVTHISKLIFKQASECNILTGAKFDFTGIANKGSLMIYNNRFKNFDYYNQAARNLKLSTGNYNSQTLLIPKRDLSNYIVWNPDNITPKFISVCVFLNLLIYEEFNLCLKISQFKKYFELCKMNYGEFIRTILEKEKYFLDFFKTEFKN